tara:strand:- start:783 stop:1172 length:390 start_codon:yes stop_codon:yes gene_type:complete
MKDRVKISYAVDMDDVPTVAGQLVEEAVMWLQNAADELAEIPFENGAIPEIAERVHEVRSSLARADQRIDDCYAITAGYHAQVADGPAPQHPQVSTVDDESGLEMERLSQHLSELQQQLRSQGGGGDNG